MQLDLKLIKSGIPIYHQIKEQIKLGIATGQLEPGTQLPTVRQLAVQLEINANTVSRVYSELESEGYLLSQQGRGTFVANASETENKVPWEGFKHLLEETIVEAHRLGYSLTDILDYLQERVDGGGDVERKSST
ncbi:MAG: GntR family transcriptional regulator [Clostridia bacterium]|nr:GntR family transcriptional regulator [Clostridia bacterium]